MPIIGPLYSQWGAQVGPAGSHAHFLEDYMSQEKRHSVLYVFVSSQVNINKNYVIYICWVHCSIYLGLNFLCIKWELSLVNQNIFKEWSSGVNDELLLSELDRLFKHWKIARRKWEIVCIIKGKVSYTWKNMHGNVFL